ncbi:hypothetical protein G6F43_004164 [Rhizopus delemar]|nr:hypothetical protein G6F43_004164 [Rhizopus delemar]
MLCYTIFHLSASPEATPNGTSSLSLLFGSDAPQIQSPWIAARYVQYNENTAKTTSTANVLCMPPSSLYTAAQVSISTPFYGYLCPSLKEATVYVGAWDGSQVIDIKPILGILTSPSQKPMPFTAFRYTVDS